MTRRTTATLKLAALIVGLAGIVGAAVGCKIRPIVPTDKTATVTAPLAEVQSHLVNTATEQGAARTDLGTVIKAPALPLALLPPLRNADDHLVKAQAETHAATTQVAVVNAKAVELGRVNLETEEKLAAAQKELNRLNMVWIAPRMERWAWAIGISLGMAAIAAGILKGPASVFPLLGALRRVALAVCTFGLTELVHFGHWVSTSIDRWHATPGTPTPVTAVPVK